MTNTHQNDTYSCKHYFNSTTCVTLTQKIAKTTYVIHVFTTNKTPPHHINLLISLPWKKQNQDFRNL